MQLDFESTDKEGTLTTHTLLHRSGLIAVLQGHSPQAGKVYKGSEDDTLLLSERIMQS